MEIVIDSVFGGLGMIGCFNCLITGIWLQPDCPITLSELRNFFTLYVVSRFCDDIKYMTNKPPRFIWKWCWKIISPVTIFLVLSMSIKSMSETTPQYSVWDASKVLVLPYLVISNVTSPITKGMKHILKHTWIIFFVWPSPKYWQMPVRPPRGHRSQSESKYTALKDRERPWSQ